MLQIYQHASQSKPIRRIEMIGEELHLFGGATALANTHTGPDHPSVKVIRESSGAILGRMGFEILGAPHSPPLVRFSLLSEDGKVTASISRHLFADVIEIRSAVDESIFLKATLVTDGTWQVEIDESRNVEDVPLVLLFAWYRSQPMKNGCLLRSAFDTFTASVHVAAPIVLSAAMFTYMGWQYYKRENTMAISEKSPV